MISKRYQAPDMRRAIRLIREELGPDAMILSNRSVQGGVEVMAAAPCRPQVQQALNLKADSASRPSSPGPSPGAQRWSGAGRDSRRILAQASKRKNSVHPRGRDHHLEPQESLSAGEGQTPLAMAGELKELRALIETQLSGMVWRDFDRRNPLKATMVRKLRRLGVNATLARSISSSLPAQPDPERSWRMALAELARRVPLAHQDVCATGGVVALLGPTGVGKTTTVAKIAARFALAHGNKSVALITTDSYRVGAHEQLRIFSRIIDIPMRVAKTHDELSHALRHFYDRRLVLIDTAGMSQRDRRFSEQVRLVRHSSPMVSSYLVLSATAQPRSLSDALRGFGGAHVDGCVLTKLDESYSLGGALSVVIDHRIPIAYVTDGQRVPEDLSRPADGAAIVEQAMVLTRRGAPAEPRATHERRTG